MARKKKKTQKIRKHEYVIFIVGGALAVAVAIFAAYYSAQPGKKAQDGYWIRINTGDYVYDGFIYNSDPGKSFKTQLPLSVRGKGSGRILRLPAHVSLGKSRIDFVKGSPGEIIYDPEVGKIFMLGDTRGQSRKAVLLGRLDDFMNLNWNEPVDIPVHLELR